MRAQFQQATPGNKRNCVLEVVEHIRLEPDRGKDPVWILTMRAQQVWDSRQVTDTRVAGAGSNCGIAVRLDSRIKVCHHSAGILSQNVKR